MRSLRARVFVTVAIVLAAATLASGLLSRRATLVEDRQLLIGPGRVPPLEEITADVRSAYTAGGWPRVAAVLRGAAARLDSRFLAVDRSGQAVAASSAELDAAEVVSATPEGGLSIRTRREGVVARMDLRGIPVIPVRDAEGGDAGRVYVLPPESDTTPVVEGAFVFGWIGSTIGTALVALLLAFTLSGRILRPVTELTAAARRMREGDLDVRVTPRGDDEIARLARAFNEMAERLARTERTKRQMVSDVAHELRSPVTNLRCGLEAIQDGLVTLDRTRIDALHSETLLLQRLIGDLQDLALADAGGLALRSEPVDVAAAAQRAAAADAGDPPIVVSVPPEARVRADAGRVEQVLRNLVSNARRHTPREGRIEIRAVRDGALVRISVSDTGCGIAPEHLAHVFDRFYRVDESRDRASGGAGLGLAIVRRLVEAQGGTATATSGGPGQGTTVTVTLPAAP